MLEKRRLSRLGLCGLALAMGVETGCLQFMNPVEPLPKEEVRDQFEIPVACKNGVYVFFLQGVDPFELSNLGGVHDYVRSLGYIKTYYGQPYHKSYYEKEIAAIHERDPKARFVLIGFSYGAGLIRDLACDLEKQSIDIDLVVYIDGVEVGCQPLIRPSNVCKVVNTSKRPRRYPNRRDALHRTRR